MTNATQRAIVRWIHILLSIPIAGYIYSPFDQLHSFAWMVRLIFLPVLVLSGLWMWKGHVVRAMLSNRPSVDA